MPRGEFTPNDTALNTLSEAMHIASDIRPPA
jgi:hypothetical protein